MDVRANFDRSMGTAFGLNGLYENPTNRPPIEQKADRQGQQKSTRLSVNWFDYLGVLSSAPSDTRTATSSMPSMSEIPRDTANVSRQEQCPTDEDL